MATNKKKITIIGTGCIGTSIGLALRQSKDAEHLQIAGHDREHGRARLALQAGAFDSAPFNLDMALNNASLVILAVPLAELHALLESVGQLIEPTGAVITDVAPLKVPVREWAAASLPEGVHYVGGAPLLAPDSGGWQPLEGPKNASVDLFKDAIYAITANVNEHPSAVRTVQNLALTLGATPYYMDAVEHDSVRALVEAVPDLVATAVFDTLYSSPGWPEARKVAGRVFALATGAAYGDVDSRRMLIQLNKTGVVHSLDGLIERLSVLREAVQQGDSEMLEHTLRKISQNRDVWLLQVAERAWEPDPRSAMMPTEGLFDRTLQALLGDRLSGNKRE